MYKAKPNYVNEGFKTLGLKKRSTIPG
jgi:hypothetical protein